MWQRFGFCVLAVTVMELSGSLRPAQAQPNRPAPLWGPRDLFAELDDEEIADRGARPELVMTGDQFEKWVFGRVGGADRARSRLETRLAWEINRVDAVCRFTPEQRKKLEIAGQGDIKRFFDRLGAVKADLGRKAGLLDARALLRELLPVRMQVEANVFVDGSIFVKTLKTTLTPEQLARYDTWTRDFYRLRVQWVAFSLDVGTPMSSETRTRLATMIMSQTRPLRRYDGAYDFQAILYQASRIPEAKLRPIFDDAQWRVLQLHFDDAKKQGEFLVAHGYVHAHGPGDPEPTEGK
jgi:hypothetical protein